MRAPKVSHVHEMAQPADESGLIIARLRCKSVKRVRGIGEKEGATEACRTEGGFRASYVQM